jgi:hypothetical protein
MSFRKDKVPDALKSTQKLASSSAGAVLMLVHHDVARTKLSAKLML